MGSRRGKCQVFPTAAWTLLRHDRVMDTVSPPRLRSPRLLLVDCNDTLRASLQAWLLQEFPDCHVETADSRESAEALAAEMAPLTILVNIDDRRGHGYAAVRSIRAFRREVLIVALSLYPVEYFREPAIRAGANYCACIALTDDRLRDLLRVLLPAQAEVKP